MNSTFNMKYESRWVLVNGMANFAKRNKKELLLMKVGFKKANVCVSCEYLRYIMRKVRFEYQ